MTVNMTVILKLHTAEHNLKVAVAVQENNGQKLPA
jgi:hypothetical protein